MSLDIGQLLKEIQRLRAEAAKSSAIKVKIKKLDEKATVPEYARPGDAGLDLTATKCTPGRGYMQYSTGLALSIPRGYVGLIFPRSSISKTTQSLANCVGVIDSGYRGEVLIRMRTHDFPGVDKMYKTGDKVAQLIIMRYPKITLEEVDELDDTERSSGGFGSTD